MMCGMRCTQIALLSALALTGCRSVVSLQELADIARRVDIRCLAVESDMTVASPFSPEYTDGLLRKVRTNLEAIEALFEVDVPSTLVVRFVGIEMPNLRMQEDGEGGFDLEGLERPSVHGVVGFAGGAQENPTVTIYVVPESAVTLNEGKQASIIFYFHSADDTIRHELTHVCAKLANMDGPTWFDEGIALELEYREMDEAGVLVPTSMPRTLRLARDQRDSYSIDAVLDWEEQGERIHAGEEQPFHFGRPLAHALMRFLLERTPGKNMRAKLERILATDLDEIRALGPEWKTWLEALPPDE